MIKSLPASHFPLALRPEQPTFLLEDPFNKLSDEMVLQVLQWLPKKTLLRCALISRRFSRLVNDESLWTRLDLGSKILKDGILAVILSRGVVILRLAQSCIYDEVFGVHRHLLSSECKLQYLDLSMARISPKGLAELLRCCRHLKKLSLEHVQLDEAICLEIAQNTDMEALNLVLCEGLTTRGVQQMFTHLTCLQSLNIAWTSLTSDQLELFCDNVSSSVLRLNISGCRKTMTDEVLEKLVSRLPLLQELDLSDCTLLSSDAVTTLSTLRHLEYISLSRCYKLASFQSYLGLRNIPTLQFLDVFGTLSDVAMEQLTKAFHPVAINKFIHSAVARPTVGTRRTSIWGLRTRN